MTTDIDTDVLQAASDLSIKEYSRTYLLGSQVLPIDGDIDYIQGVKLTEFRGKIFKKVFLKNP
jgi:hypothetical protein